MLHPEDLAGTWEASDGHGGAVGINIVVDTEVPGRPASLRGQPQFLRELTAGVFHRSGPELESHQSNFFITTPSGGGSWDGQRLAAFLPEQLNTQRTALDLLWDENARTWSGWFERGTFRHLVVLERPPAKGSSRFTGTWRMEGRPMTLCLHMVEKNGGFLTAWSDLLDAPGPELYANGLKPLTQTPEIYGLRAAASKDHHNELHLQLDAEQGACCSRVFNGKFSANGQSLIGAWEPDAGVPTGIVRWSKLPGTPLRKTSLIRTPAPSGLATETSKSLKR